jgi:hypothetical protein
MPRIKKDELLPHAVICDTSILWCEDKAPVANPEFEKFWGASSTEYALELHIPETVRGELLYQQTISGQKLLKSTEDNIKKLSSITAASHATRISADKIRKQVEGKFDKWLKAKRGKIIPVPAHQVDWKRVANDAIWRIAPFISDPKNPDFEKGFRDALILETVCQYVKADSRKINIAFLCNDGVLRDSARERLKADARFTAYDNIAGFESYLRLTKEKLTKEFISKIVNHASDRFFLRDDERSLVNRDKLLEKIKTDFKDFISDPAKSEKSMATILGGTFSSNPWNPVGTGGYWVFGPEFIKIEPEQRYIWKSEIRYLRLYSRTASFSTLIGGAGKRSDERVLLLPFHVTWSAMVKNDARFHDMRVEKIELVGNDFHTATTDEIKKYQLRPEPAAAPTAESGGGSS